MDLFNNKKIESLKTELESTKSSFNNFVLKSTDNIEALERMIAREQSNVPTVESIESDYYKIGDPYLHNIYVRKSIDKIAESISSVPIIIENSAGNPVPENNPAQQLFDYISDYESPQDFIFEIVRNLFRFGKCHIRMIGSVRGLPQVLDVLPADKVKAKVNASNVLTGWEYRDGKNQTIFTPEEIVFLRFKHPTDLYDGLAPGSSAMKEVLQDFYAQAYNILYFKRGAMGKGVWVPSDGGPALTPQQQEELAAAVDATFNKGLQSAHRQQVSKRPLAWQSTSDSRKDMEYQQLLEAMRDAIYVVYDIPKVLFASAESTFTNLKEAKKMFWSQTLKPVMTKIADNMNTNFFDRLNLPFKFTFDLSSVPELQEDLNEKIDTAKKMSDMGIPVSVINQVLDLGLPEEGYEGWDTPNNQPSFAFDTQSDTIKTVKDYIKQSRIEEEKQIGYDNVLKQMEYHKSVTVMKSYEPEIENKTNAFYRQQWKKVEKWLEENPPTEEKDVDGSWLTKFTTWLDDLDLGLPFFNTLKSTIRRVYEDGRRRTYWGIGADFQLNDLQAETFLSNRGLKLVGSPDVVKKTIIRHISSGGFTSQEIAKEISKTWKKASEARAKNIAITETTNAYNGGRVDGMKELGIRKKEWVNSGDGNVRDSHRITSVVGVDDLFELSDGEKVRWPGDGSPGNACNCRCVVISRLE